MNGIKRRSHQGWCKDMLLSSTMRFPTNNRNQKTQHNTGIYCSSCNQKRLPTPHGSHSQCRGTGKRVTAVTAWGKRPVPFRTRKLRPTAPMVLHPRECGRVGHRRTTIRRKAPPPVGPFALNPPHPKHTPPSTWRASGVSAIPWKVRERKWSDSTGRGVHDLHAPPFRIAA